MNHGRPSDSSLQRVLAGSRGSSDWSYLVYRDLLRCRRALRKIERLFDPGNGVTYDMIATEMLRVAQNALGKRKSGARAIKRSRS